MRVLIGDSCNKRPAAGSTGGENGRRAKELDVPFEGVLQLVTFNPPAKLIEDDVLIGRDAPSLNDADGRSPLAALTEISADDDRRRIEIVERGIADGRGKIAGGDCVSSWVIFDVSRVRQPTFAGLWDQWRDRASGETLKSCTMIITEPNAFVAEVHDRMPVILGQKDFEPWLRNEAGLELLKPAPEELLQRWPVSQRVKSSKAPVGDPTLIEQITI